MKILSIEPFNYSTEYRGVESTITGDPYKYASTTGVFLDDLIESLQLCKRQGIKLKPVELNFELE